MSKWTDVSDQSSKRELYCACLVAASAITAQGLPPTAPGGWSRGGLSDDQAAQRTVDLADKLYERVTTDA